MWVFVSRRESSLPSFWFLEVELFLTLLDLAFVLSLLGSCMTGCVIEVGVGHCRYQTC